MDASELDAVRDRFWDKVDRRGPDECWPWQATIEARGYGRFRLGEMSSVAHRVAYQLAHGELGDDVRLTHTCDDRSCVNPAHLSATGSGTAWTDEEDRLLRRMYCFMPVDWIAEQLERTTNAIQIRRRVLHIPPLQRREDVLSITHFAEAIGLCHQAALRLAKSRPFSMTMYHGNRPVTVVDKAAFMRWLRQPANWQVIDVDKLVEPEFKKIVSLAQQKHQANGDLMTMVEAAEYAGYSRKGLYKIVRRGDIPFTRDLLSPRGGRKRILIKRCDIDAFLGR